MKLSPGSKVIHRYASEALMRPIGHQSSFTQPQSSQLSSRGSLQLRRVASVLKEPPKSRSEDGPSSASTANRNIPTKGQPKPGKLDDDKFVQHWSVEMWRDFRIPPSITDENASVSERGQALARVLQDASRRAGVFDSPQSLAYWAYHVSRMGFFAVQGLAGVLYSNYATSQTPGDSSGISPKSPAFTLQRLLTSGIYFPLSEAVVMFYQDYENVRKGIYKLPWDMTTVGHKQTNPLNIVDKFSRFLREANSTLTRRAAGKPDKVWLESGLYPQYYLNSWHYQTDGWLSDESAKVYEASTETLFVGRQDAMQRQSLVPLKEFMDARGSTDGSGLRLLEVAGGTGRFATFVKDNFPRLGITQVELSPFYLQEARKNMDYWRRMRGGRLQSDTAESEDRFLHAPAENIPAPDNSYDVVTSTYLFHELPGDARKKAVSEMVRVLKPGGMVIFNDGNQLGDRPINDAAQGNFQAFNEPNWGTHIALDYGALFQEAGLQPGIKVLASGSKVLSFTKPLKQA